MEKRLRMALIGGGFIGRVHARAAQLDGRIELVAGALSSDPEKAMALAGELGIPEERAYSDWSTLIGAETGRSDGVDLVAVATPNDTHHPIVRALLAAKLPVVCEKPLTVSLAQAEDLASVQAATGTPLALMHNYTGYALVRQARAMIATGELGTVIAARAVYLQGSNWRTPEPGGKPRAVWRLDPQRQGLSGCFADIGTHAYNLLQHVTQLPAEALSCSLRTFTPDRTLDDYGTATLRLSGGALATITASKVSHGRENALSIHVDGTKGSLEWHQESPNELLHRQTGQPMRVLTRDARAPWMHADARASIRLPAGHPEGFQEAFANIYTAFLPDVIAFSNGQPVSPAPRLYPDLADGVDEMRFVERCLESSGADGSWLKI